MGFKSNEAVKKLDSRCWEFGLMDYYFVITVTKIEKSILIHCNFKKVLNEKNFKEKSFNSYNKRNVYNRNITNYKPLFRITRHSKRLIFRSWYWPFNFVSNV